MHVQTGVSRATVALPNFEQRKEERPKWIKYRGHLLSEKFLVLGSLHLKMEWSSANQISSVIGEHKSLYYISSSMLMICIFVCICIYVLCRAVNLSFSIFFLFKSHGLSVILFIFHVIIVLYGICFPVSWAQAYAHFIDFYISFLFYAKIEIGWNVCWRIIAKGIWLSLCNGFFVGFLLIGIY